MLPSRSVPRGQEGRGEDGGQDNGQTGLGPLLLPRPQVSPTLTAEELTNQVLEIRGTAAGTDLWVTFEIREHGELGECDRAPETAGSPRTRVRDGPGRGSRPLGGALCSPRLPFRLEGGSCAQAPKVGGTQDLILTSSFPCLHPCVDERIHSHGSKCRE